MNIHNLKSCEELIGTYVNKYGGEATEVREGVLGLGTIVLHNAEGKKSIVINEVYLNPWSSGHTVRRYNSLPKKYEKLIESI